MSAGEGREVEEEEKGEKTGKRVGKDRCGEEKGALRSTCISTPTQLAYKETSKWLFQERNY